MKPNRDITLSSQPVIPWKPIEWEKIPQLPWPHKMINLASSWSIFYPCKKCGLCCKNPPLIKIKDDKAYYLPRGPEGYCIMYDREHKLCKIYEQRPLECRLLVCRAPESVKKRLENLLVKFLTEYASEFENISSEEEIISKLSFEKSPEE
ncbi:MAG TPA: YkgJ family cysteine cluster protein [Candidatus Eremiobacteraeota bacterium]|nr:MAG: Flagellin N-methylase [bacterium ADurb.Bin363]HPZ07899.1 YkgJ family cysteine cluster protein [Candidatus Eremiobacteraeota bacterium]